MPSSEGEEQIQIQIQNFNFPLQDKDTLSIENRTSNSTTVFQSLATGRRGREVTALGFGVVGAVWMVMVGFL